MTNHNYMYVVVPSVCYHKCPYPKSYQILPKIALYSMSICRGTRRQTGYVLILFLERPLETN